VPRQTEPDRFAEFIESGAVMTSVTHDSITVEGAESRTKSDPRVRESLGSS
jgi:hypothetical protein